jgi:hypothetical protein
LAACGPAEQLSPGPRPAATSMLFQRFGGLYGAVNAATMTLVAGDRPAAGPGGRRSADSAAAGPGGGGGLLRGRQPGRGAVPDRRTGRCARDDESGPGAARRRLSRPTPRPCANWRCCAAKPRWTRLAVSVPAAGLRALHRPHPGRLARRRPDRRTGRRPAREADRVVREQGIGFAYGGLAAGADIVFAEALLEAGAELHLVLPVNLDSFVAVSVAPFGTDWVRALRALLHRAPRRCATPRRIPMSAMSRSSPMPARSPWAARCCAPRPWRPRRSRWRSGTATRPRDRPAWRWTWPIGRKAAAGR